MSNRRRNKRKSARRGMEYKSPSYYGGETIHRYKNSLPFAHDQDYLQELIQNYPQLSEDEIIDLLMEEECTISLSKDSQDILKEKTGMFIQITLRSSFLSRSKKTSLDDMLLNVKQHIRIFCNPEVAREFQSDMHELIQEMNEEGHSDKKIKQTIRIQQLKVVVSHWFDQFTKIVSKIIPLKIQT